jgi:ligand-binding SRPBCC domain-containing protein
VAEALGFERTSRLAAPPEAVWAHATTLAGVNRELWPLARMTHPRGRDRLDPAEIAPGRPLFRSWILLLGVLPVDWDELCFERIEPGRFIERSRMLTQREWRHERVVAPAPGGCTVTDRLRFVPRAAWLGRLQLPVFQAAFRLRHRNLRRLFGGAALDR